MTNVFGSTALMAATAIALAAMPSPRLVAIGAEGSAQAQAQDISPEALAQIDALLREKASRNPVQRKMDSQLIYELKMARGQSVAAGVQTLATDLPYTDDDRIVLDVTGTITGSVLQQLRDMGVEAQSVDRGGASVRVAADLSAVEAMAALPEVSFIQPRQDAVTSRVGPTPSIEQRRLERRLRQMQQLSAFLRGTPSSSGPDTSAGTGVGSVSSQGDVSHRAFAARGAFKVNGSGIKIGVLSDGVRNLAASQATGDLGPVTVLEPAAPCPAANTCDEGTAMLEIVHDLAPGAQLYFASAFVSITSFAGNIRALRAAGCDVIVDDVFYFVETPFQDGQAPGVISTNNAGVVLQAVNDVTADGAMYFSSAGNSGNLNDGTAGVWEGDFADGGPVAGQVATMEGGIGRLHSFGGQAFDVLNAIGSQNNLSWSDPLGASANDYDLFRLNAAGTVVQAASLNIQDGTQDPYEAIGAGAVGTRLVIVKFSGEPRFLHLNTNRGRLAIATQGQTHGHSSAAAAYAVAATPAGAGFTSGFSIANKVETFSSDGPRRVFFDAAGAPITPGNVSATGGLVRQKPDITAADGVSVTGVGGFGSPFFGTSAAAPHAAAIAALVKAANPGLTPSQIRTFLSSTAIDIEAAGIDRDSGVGIVMPVAALQASGATGTAWFAVTSAVATEHPGNGNGIVNGGEGATLAVSVQNFGVHDATRISAALVTATPAVTLTLPTGTAFPDMLALTGSGANASPLLFTLAPNAPCPLDLDFSLALTYADGTQNVPFQVATRGPMTLASTLDTIAPLPGAGFTGTTGVQTGRIVRNGVISSCATQKPFPGINDPGLRQYDAYAFAACAEASPTCATVAFSAANGINMFSAAYAPSFGPANISANFRGDPGASAASRTYSFTLSPAESFAVTVHDVPALPPPALAVPSGSAYTLAVSGVCAGSCATPNHVPVARAKNVTMSADASCTAAASINDGSSDEDGDPLTITQSPAGPYPLGTTQVLLSVSDTQGATSQATATVTVNDTTPPAVTEVSAVPQSRGRVGGDDFVTFLVSYDSVDSCSPGGSCVLSVSTAPSHDGDGNRENFLIVDAHHVRLRADNSGKGSAGRAYTITVTCTDGAGNKTVKTVTVLVPKGH